MASQMINKEDSNELMKAFTSIDTDGNGILSREELITGYKKIYKDVEDKKIEKIVDDLIAQVDITKEGGILFTQFVAAAINSDRLLHEKQIEKAFAMFDEDGNGFIDLVELKSAMSGLKLTDEEWKDLILQYDTDDDGRVSLIF